MPLASARTLFLQGQGLLDDPGRTANGSLTLAEIRRLGFVQLDSINIVERAHHHILWARLHGYRTHLLEGVQHSGRIFEHWTHDVSIIPAEWFPHWRHRFARVAWGAWLQRRLGRERRVVLQTVLERIRREGPLQARDFERPGRTSGPWWDWKPAKAALEYWWRRGELAIPRRIRFEKVYDLTERVLPHVYSAPAPDRAEHIEWACRAALDRLAVATPREIAGFWALASQQEAVAWCKRALAKGEIVAVEIESSQRARPAFAVSDWRARLSDAPPPPRGMRLLSPFDPLIRDRARCQRLFGFDYRFEAFVPGPRRRYGYYVLPILDGDRLVGRLDPKHDRETETLHVRNIWWEPGVKPTRARLRELESALDRYRALLGASSVELEADATSVSVQISVRPRIARR